MPKIMISLTFIRRADEQNWLKAVIAFLLEFSNSVWISNSCSKYFILQQKKYWKLAPKEEGCYLNQKITKECGAFVTYQELWNLFSKALCDLLRSPLSKPMAGSETDSEVMGMPHHRIVWVRRNLQSSSSSNRLQWAGTSSSRGGCSEPHPAWPWMSAGTVQPVPVFYLLVHAQTGSTC